MDLVQISYFLGVSILLTLAPGPDILYVLAQSLSLGKRAGIFTALGLCSGLVIHILMVAVGVATLLKNSPWGFKLIQYAGAGYLFFLAYKTWQENFNLHRQNLMQENIATGKNIFNPRRLFKQGFLMSSLNPKLIVFFLAFFPQFLRGEGGNKTLQIFILGFIFIAQAFLIFSSVSYFADFFGKNLRDIKFLKAMNYGKAIFLFLLALSLLMEF